MVRLTVRRRIVLILLIVSIVPLVIANEIWLLSSQAQLRKDAAFQQELLVKSSADDVNSYINGKVDAAIIHSQSADVQNMQIPEAQAELSAYLKQDGDILQASLVDENGIQRLLVNRSGATTQIVNVSSSDAFRVVTFLGGEDYISPLSFNAQKTPFITISIPLTSYASTQSGNYLSTSEPGVILAPSAIKGALIIQVALNQLWNSVLNYKLGQAGYAYVVDNQGNIIAYPDAHFVMHHRSLATVSEVKDALAETIVPGAPIPSPVPHQTVSETGVKVLSSHYLVSRTGWRVIAEEPINSVYAPANNDVRIAAILFTFSALIGITIIMLTARSLLQPIRVLSDGADKLANGDLSYRIFLSRRDEFGLLALTFNNMAAKIHADIAKLQDLDQLKNEFIAIASHNLRTPLTVIHGYIDLLKIEPVSTENRELVDAIEAGVEELSGFSEDLLAISSIRADNTHLHVSNISIAELMKPLQTQFNPKAAEKGVQLRWSLPTDPHASAHVSKVHIRSALSNLLINAIEFTPKGGHIDCSFTYHDQQYVMSVRDTGSGIAPAEMKKLFTTFHRGTSTVQYDHPGTGIGLYLTMLIIEAHHGHITVRSQVGHGSTFKILLPIPGKANEAVKPIT